MKTILKSKLLMIIFIIGLSISCKSKSASTVQSDSDAIKAGDSTSLNTGTNGTTAPADTSNPFPDDKKATK